MTISYLDHDDEQYIDRTNIAEQAVIGCMLNSTEAIDRVTTILRFTDFKDVELAEIFRAITDLRSGGALDGEVDWILVAGRARTFRRLGPIDLQRLATSAPRVGNAAQYARQVRDFASIRQYQDAIRVVSEAIGSGADAETVANVAQNAMTKAGTVHTAVGRKAKEYEAMMAEVDAPYDWIIPGFLERADRFVLTGVEGLGKSTLLRQMALATAAGVHCWTGKPIPPKRVLAIDVENHEKQWRRKTAGMAHNLREAGGDFGERMWVECTGRLDLSSGTDLASTHRLIDQHDPDMILIGPLYKLSPKGITTDDDAAPIITALDSIRDRGITLLLETHMGHAKTALGKRDVRPRGSSALLGWPEFGFGLIEASNEASEGMPIPGMVEMLPWRGQRDERPWPDMLMRGGDMPWRALDPIRDTWTNA